MSDELRCYYCHKPIAADDDAQRIEHGKFAHTECVFSVSDTALELEDESDDAD